MSLIQSTSGPYLSENRRLRLVSLFILYFVQVIPLGLCSVALPAWLSANGASDTDVASVMGAAFLPWSFKFIPAALIDRYAYLPMGRRRLWLILSFALMISGFLAAALIGPGVEDIQLLVAVSFLTSAGGAVQDVAVDGLALDVVPDREQGPASSVIFSGQMLGTAFSAALAGYLLSVSGSRAAFMSFLPVLGAAAVYVMLILERPGEKRFPWSPGAASPINLERQVGAWLPIAVLTLKALWTRDSIIQIVSSALYRTGAGVMSPVFPILATTALTFDEATYSSTASALKVGIGFALIPIGTFATTRMGPKRAAILIYLLLALLSLFISGGKELWLITLIFVAMFALNSMTNALAMICGNAMRMELCDPRVAATQFTIYNSLSNLPLALGTGVFAMLGGTKELTIVVLASAALFVLAAVVLLFIRIGGPQAREVPPS